MKWIAALILCLFPCIAWPEEAAPFDPREFARQVTVDDLGKHGWTLYVVKAEARYSTYREDNSGGTRDVFLNDELACLAVSLKTVQDLKKLIAWVALYAVWEIALPDKIEKLLCEREEDLKIISKSFSWDKLLALAKSKDNR